MKTLPECGVPLDDFMAVQATAKWKDSRTGEVADVPVWDFRHKQTGRKYGDYLREFLQLPEMSAVDVVFQKHRRAHGLACSDRQMLMEFAFDFSRKRAAMDKPAGRDFLIQECGAELRRMLARRSTHHAEST